MRRYAAILISLALIFAFVARGYVHRYALPLPAAVCIHCSFVLLLAFAIAPGVRGSREAVGKWANGGRIYAFLPLWCVPYLIYAAGTRDFRWPALVHLLIVPAPVLLVYRNVPVRNVNRFCWQDALVGIWLIHTVVFHAFRNIWNVPVNLDFMGRLFLITVGSWSWIFVRTLPGIGYEFSISSRVLKAAAANFGLLAIIAIPASLALHFTTWNPRWRGLVDFTASFLEILLFIALLEELFFRGFLQNLLSKSLQSWKLGQLVAACLFGLFHILHAPFPNWRYVLLATVAGWFYGSAYRQGGNLMASTLVHALVDTVWRTWLTR